MDQESDDFIKKTYKRLNYRSLSEYVRVAVAAKVRDDRRKLRDERRTEAMDLVKAAMALVLDIDPEHCE